MKAPSEINSEEKEVLKELKWLKTAQDNEPYFPMEKTIKSKILQNPFVPLGFLATVGALSYGLFYFQKGDRKKQQLMMRYRVLFQGFTIFAASISLLFFQENKDKHKYAN